MDSDILRRAKTYPYPIPGRSYLLEEDGHRELDGDFPDLGGRRPVLACGSNQSPRQLGRKFGDGWGTIPAIRAWLNDFDVVYSAHFTDYGSIPATLQHAPGTSVCLFVTWLTPAQEDRMHDTEALGMNYDFGRLDGIELAMDGGGVLDHAFAYISRRGCVDHRGMPLAIAEIGAKGRLWPALEQPRMLDLARRRLDPGCHLDDFLAAIIADVEVRRSHTETLMSRSRPFAYPQFTKLAP